MIKLLIVEDDAMLRYIMQSSFQQQLEGYEVLTAENGEEGLTMWEQYHPDAIVSDIVMPQMDGFEMVKRIRETDGDTIIFFASTLVTPEDVKQGFAVGANNYVKKPFTPDELDAHIQAILKIRHQGKFRNESNAHTLGNYVLDADKHTLLHQASGFLKKLTLRETQLLKLLAENKNEIIRRETILKRFWNTEADFYASRSLDVFITGLRKLFKEDPRVKIENVRGVGLRLSVDNA